MNDTATDLKEFECPVAGFCRRHGINKTEKWHSLCRQADYRRQWDAGKGPGQVEAKPREMDRAARLFFSRMANRITSGRSGECIHRGGFLRVDKCDMCGGEKGQPVEVFRCAIHGECTLNKKIRKIRGCAACEDFKPHAAVNRGPFHYDGSIPEFVTTSQYMRDVQILASMLPPDTSRVIGVSRSGLCAATMIAMLLH